MGKQQYFLELGFISLVHLPTAAFGSTLIWSSATRSRLHEKAKMVPLFLCFSWCLYFIIFSWGFSRSRMQHRVLYSLCLFEFFVFLVVYDLSPVCFKLD
jgi:hypothetical protein